MPTTPPLPIDQPYRSVDDVIQGLSALERAFATRRDKRGVFVTAYLPITREIQRRIDAGHFEDNEWVTRYLLAFANLYRNALVAYEAGDLGAVPKPWRLAFDAAADGVALLLQHLILGINAHVNHDLPLALLDVTIDPDRASRERDHTAVNEALVAATGPVQQRLSEIYAPGLRVLDVAAGPLDELVTNFSFEKARAAAWAAGVRLVDAGSAAARDTVQAQITDEAAVLARLLLQPNSAVPLLFEVLTRVEAWHGEWPTLFSSDGVYASRTDPVGASLPSGDLGKAMQQLETAMARLDRQRSRLAAIVAYHLVGAREVGLGMSDGSFEDPEWAGRLEAQLVQRFLRALDAFEAQRTPQVPHCWQTAFQATASGEAILLQTIVLARNAQWNYDLPLALADAAPTRDDLTHRLADYNQLDELHEAGVTSVHAALARHYADPLGVIENLPSILDALLVDFQPERAHEDSLGAARAFAYAGAPQQRTQLAADLDVRTTRRSERVLLRSIVRESWAVPMLRAYERSCDGAWSGWLLMQPTLYERVLGDDFEMLAAPLQRLLGQRMNRRASGSLRLTHGNALAQALLGCASADIPLRLEVVTDNGREHWFFVVAGHAVAIEHSVQGDNIVVGSGPLRTTFRPVADRTSVRFAHLRSHLLAVPIPMLLASTIHAELSVHGDAIAVDASVSVPLLGRILRAQGMLVPS